jgi:hypothetical protein
MPRLKASQGKRTGAEPDFPSTKTHGLPWVFVRQEPSNLGFSPFTNTFFAKGWDTMNLNR